jgi:phosphohistidine phosphatase
MPIYLVQHGRSQPKSADPEQGLSPEGRAEVERISQVAAGYGVAVAAIDHSGKKRARQTADILAAALRPAQGVAVREGLKPMDEVAGFGQALEADSNRMVVGHLPFMERLTGWLVTGESEKPPFRFQNGGIVCLDRTPDGDRWWIQWTLMPHIGRR